MFTMLFSSRVRVVIRVRIRFCVWSVSGYAHVFVLLSTVIVTLPLYGILGVTVYCLIPETLCKPKFHLLRHVTSRHDMHDMSFES